jgi:hypothetical protein
VNLSQDCHINLLNLFVFLASLPCTVCRVYTIHTQFWNFWPQEIGWALVSVHGPWYHLYVICILTDSYYGNLLYGGEYVGALLWKLNIHINTHLRLKTQKTINTVHQHTVLQFSMHLVGTVKMMLWFWEIKCAMCCSIIYVYLKSYRAGTYCKRKFQNFTRLRDTTVFIGNS